MGRKQKSSLSVFWMPRKRKNRHHSPKNHESKPPKNHSTFGTPSRRTQEIPMYSGESSNCTICKPHTPPVVVASTSFMNDDLYLENKEAVAEINTESAEETEKKEGCDEADECANSGELENPNKKPNTDSDEEKEGCGFECLYVAIHCCECSIS